MCSTQIGGLGVLDGIDLRKRLGIHGLNDYRYLTFDKQGVGVGPEEYHIRNILTDIRAPKNADVLERVPDLVQMLEQLLQATRGSGEASASASASGSTPGPAAADAATEALRTRTRKDMSHGWNERDLPQTWQRPGQLTESLERLHRHLDRRVDGVCSVWRYEAPEPPVFYQ